MCILHNSNVSNYKLIIIPAILWHGSLSFQVIHAFVNLLYFLPCLAIAYTSANYKTSGLTTYFQLTFTAGMAGMIAALFELNKPWPQRRGQLPFLFHEVVVRFKLVFLAFQFSLVNVSHIDMKYNNNILCSCRTIFSGKIC